MNYPLKIAIAGLVSLIGVNSWASDDIRVADQQLFDRLDADGSGQIASDEVASSHTKLFARLLRLGDANQDGELNEDEWQAALQPQRPAKPMEQKRSAELPGADAARLMLLKLDVNRDARLTAAEVPSELHDVFDRIVERYDRNDDGNVNQLELGRGGPQLMRMAQRTVKQLKLDVEAELAKLEQEQGDDFNRFDLQPTPEQMLGNPKQALALFEQLDTNKDGELELSEVPEQARQRASRLLRRGDRNGDKKLSKSEFLEVSKRISRFMNSGRNKSQPKSKKTSKGASLQKS